MTESYTDIAASSLTPLPHAQPTRLVVCIEELGYSLQSVPLGLNFLCQGTLPLCFVNPQSAGTARPLAFCRIGARRTAGHYGGT